MWNVKAFSILAVLSAMQALLPENQKQMTLLVRTLAIENFPSDRSTYIFSNEQNYELLSSILENINEAHALPLNILKATAKSIQEPHYLVGSYILLVDDCEDLEATIIAFNWNSRMKFLVIVTKVTSEVEALCIGQAMWHTSRIVNAVVVLSQLLYTWYPYKSYKSCNTINNVFLLGNWSEQNNINLFPDKVPKDFHGCTIDVALGNNSTEEHLLVQALIEQLNVTPQHHFLDRNEPDKLKTVTYALGCIIAGIAEVAYGGIPLHEKIAKYGDYTAPYIDAAIKWYVPCGKPYSRIETSSRIFTGGLYVCLGITVLLLSFLMKIMTKWCMEKTSFRNIYSGTYNIFAMALGEPITKFPQSSQLRLILLSWVCFSFALSTIFQTFFTSYLVDPGMQRKLGTLEELLESGIKFGYRKDLDFFYQGSELGVHKEIKKRRELCSPAECVERLLTSGKYATLREAQRTKQFIQLGQVCLLNDYNVFFIQPVAYIRRGSVLLEAINKVFIAFVESGICSKIYLSRGFRYRERKLEEAFAFQIEHLAIAFHLLLFGTIISMIVFLCELLWSRFTGYHTIKRN